MRKRFIGFLALLVTVVASAQTNQTSNKAWHLADPATDSVLGISLPQAYSLLHGRPARTVIVAILDSGVDIDHEDLQGVIWTNPGEIPDNGKDDDGNGYIDDVHGWNFLGGASGDVSADTYELTREYVRLRKLVQSNSGASTKVMASYKKVEREFESLREKNRMQYEAYENSYRNLASSIDTLKRLLHRNELSLAAIDSFQPQRPSHAFAKGYTLYIIKQLGFPGSPETFLGQVKEGADYYRPIALYGYNADYDPRPIIGDDESNVNERIYGNNHVSSGDPDHGTHVAGIVAAVRGNQIGIDGIADHVRIMPVRMLPSEGDERDKDVANAIRYAVDNGANIINMSFGKSISPHKNAVDEAVKYAASKGVLIIHAAGNEGANNDKTENYPNRYFSSGGQATNWLEIGASGPEPSSLIADFSNYGKKGVDLFAPGVQINSTIPGNKYDEKDGTSMASPVATGVAALIWSYFPDLTASQLAELLNGSVRRFDGIKVTRPGGGTVSMSELCRAAGVINAYQAVQSAVNRKATTSNR